jgi:hypothetical protein
MVQGCSLKRFLHVPQEAAGGYINRGSTLELSDLLPLLFFLPQAPIKVHFFHYSITLSEPEANTPDTIDLRLR